jgi:phosphatidylserine/phosphatidylglycerophosphate/cardiolipin synthase-like enzyme
MCLVSVQLCVHDLRVCDESVAGTVAAARHVMSHFLRAGVRVFETTQGTLHAKIITVDGVYASVGSFNLDYLSAYRNLEVSSVYEMRVWRVRVARLRCAYWTDESYAHSTSSSKSTLQCVFQTVLFGALTARARALQAAREVKLADVQARSVPRRMLDFCAYQVARVFKWLDFGQEKMRYASRIHLPYSSSHEHTYTHTQTRQLTERLTLKRTNP